MREHVRELTKRFKAKPYYKRIILSLGAVFICCAILAFAGIFGGFAPQMVASAENNVFYTRAQDSNIEEVDTDAVELAVDWALNGAKGNAETGYYWLYDGSAKGFDATVSPSQSVDITGVDTDLTVKYQKEGSTAWSEEKPVTVGNYTVRASLTHENSGFTVNSERTFEIRKRAVIVNWVASGSSNTETDGLHWIYDGNVHKLTTELSGAAATDGTQDKLAVKVRFAAKGTGAGLSDIDETLDPKSAGEYTAFAELSGSAKDNYYIMDSNGAEIEYAQQSYKITRRYVTVTWAKNLESGNYSWVYSGFAERTTFVPAIEKQSESSTGDTGVVTGQTLAVTITYATVTSGTAGAYDGIVRVDAGKYRARASHTDGNYILINDTLDFEITKRQAEVEWNGEGNYAEEDGTLLWRYDGAEHAPSASVSIPSSGAGAVSGGAVLTTYLTVAGAESEVTSLSAYASRGYYEAVAGFKTDAPENITNNYELINIVKNFRIDKGIVTGVKWYMPDAESESGKTEITSSPSYTWGQIQGAGPNFTAEATAKVITAGGEKEVKFTLTVSYPGANYQDGESWPVNATAGYVVKAALSGTSTDGSENSERFELKTAGAGGVIAECDSMRFYVTAVAGEIEEITVTWVVFTDSTNYVELDALKNMAGGAALNAGGNASVADGKFTFVYNGKAQSPTAIYKYAKPAENGDTYEILPLGDGCKKTSAGTWTAYVKPVANYSYKAGTSECEFVITPLTIKLDWGVLSYVYNDKEHTPAPTVDAAYLNAQPDWYKTVINNMRQTGGELSGITVAGKTDAGEYELSAGLSDNFAFADNTDKAKLIIKPYEISVSAVEWTFEGAKNDTPGNKDTWYWNYDGAEHAPTPKLTVSLDGVTTITLNLKMVGAATEMGEYFAYAWLDTSDLQNKNFKLVESEENPVSAQAKQKFTIAHVEILAIYWTGAVAEDGYTGDTVVIDGVTYQMSLNGAVTLEHVFDGTDWAPKAYYKVGENYEAFEVEGAMRNVGQYSARIVGEYNIKDEHGNQIGHECTFKILPKEVTVTWQSSVDGKTLKFEYTGAEQKPGVEISGGIAGEEVTYEVTGYTDAGNYSAEIKFTNANYTYAGTSGEANFCDFIITKKQITVEWGYTGNAGMHGEGASAVPYWQFNAENPAIAVSKVNGSAGNSLNMPSLGEVAFTFDYIGLSSSVGTHTVKAVISSVALGDKALPAGNFEITDASNAQGYEITVYEVNVRWTGNAENEGKFEWTYDGNPHAPTAEYLLWDGEWRTASVSGERIVFGTYSALAVMPAEYIGNCVFAEIEVELGDGTTETRSVAVCEFKINKAKVTVKWTFDEAIYNNEKGVWELVYDGKEHAPKAFDEKTDIELTVEGKVADVGERHIASAKLPDAANYEFENDSDSFCYFTIKVKTVWIKWVDDSGEDTPEFSWYFSPNVERAPKAILANEDGSEFLIDGKVVYAIVSGGAIHAGEYTATAEIVSSNYAFPEGKTFTHLFWILPRELSEKHFWWTDADKLKDGWYVYEFNGQSQHPLAQTRNFTEFSYEFTAVDGDKTPVGALLDGITDVGEYRVHIEILNNNDYCIPVGKETVYVKITPKITEVIWDETELTYNGEDQAPEAYYTDLNGTKYPLSVTVTETVHKYAGEKYHATANFINADSIKNYALDSETAVKEYEITRRALTVTWGEHEFTYDKEEHYVTSEVDISNAIISDFIDASGMPVMSITYVIKDKDGKILKDGSGNPALGAVNAGEYITVLSLTGLDTVIKNYEIKDTADGDDKQEFVINKALLVVTADDKTVNYGDPVPVFTATYGEKVIKEGVETIIHTFIGETEADIAGMIVSGKRPWLDCAYLPGFVPDNVGYDINIDIAMLQKLLPNYEIEAVVGKLYVTATENTVIWYGDMLVGDPNFEYDGNEHKPEAYLYKNPDMLEVVYVDKDGNELTDFTAVNAGTYYVKAIAPEGVTIAANEMISYEIKPREILINIRYTEINYGDRVVAADGSNIFNAYEQSTLWDYATDKREVNGDDLGIYCTWNVSRGIKNGYLKSGTYYVEGHSNAGSNYKVIFQGLRNDDEANKQYGLYIVNKAQIYDESKDGNEWFTDEAVLERGEKYYIGISSAGTGDRRYKYIAYAGDQTATARFSYSDVYTVGRDEIPEPDENENYPHTDVNEIGISENGTYVINYRVEIENHNVYYGRWTIIIKHAEETIIVIFVKQYEIEYGTDVPENLAEVLVDGGYVEISGATSDKEYFKSIAEAVVPTGYHKFANNRTAVGEYDIFFKLNPELVNLDELSLVYSRNKQDGESNENAYSVVPRRIHVEWGKNEFKYDGKTHLPTPILSNWITEQPKTLNRISDGRIYQINDAGVNITITVYTAGNFKDSGGHKVAITIDNENYTITLMDAVQVISIEGGTTASGNIPLDLLIILFALLIFSILILLLVIILIFSRGDFKRKSNFDADGFYDKYKGKDF